MTMRDTLLDIVVYCVMAKQGIVKEGETIERILDRIKPHCDDGLIDSVINICQCDGKHLF